MYNRHMQNKEASLVILGYKGEILLILRDNKSDIVSPNHWSIPGGTKEPDESFEKCAKREIKEELQINLENLSFVVELKYLDRYKKLYYSSLSENQVKEIHLTEGQRYDFFTADDAKTLLLARSTKMFFDSHSNLIKDKLS